MKQENKIHIESINNEHIQGWFINPAEPENNKLLLYLDNQYKAVTEANIEREDVAEAHGQLQSGFCFDIKKFPKAAMVELKTDQKESVLSVKIDKNQQTKNKKKLVEIHPSYSQTYYEKIEQLTLDLSRSIDGDNWYSAEPTGRWAGPGLESTLNIPALAAGTYTLEIEVENELFGLESVEVRLNQQKIKFINTRYQIPLTLQAQVRIAKKKEVFWQLSFKFPKTSEGEGADQRKLAMFIKKITLTKKRARSSKIKTK